MGFILNGNYPNLFNLSMDISFLIQCEEYLSIDMYDFRVSKIINLFNRYNFEQAFNLLGWKNGKGNEVSIEVYFCSIQSGRFKVIKKMNLVIYPTKSSCSK